MVSNRTSSSFKRLQMLGSKVTFALHQAKTEQEFHILREQFNRIARSLGHPMLRPATLDEYKAARQELFPTGTSRTYTLPERSIAEERNNLDSVRWYLDRVGDKVAEVCAEKAAEFRACAQVASDAVADLITTLESKHPDEKHTTRENLVEK